MTKIPSYLHVSIPSQAVTEYALAAGYSGIILDMQHGELSLDSTKMLLRSVHQSTRSVLVRMPSTASDSIGPVLDAGAAGIIIPTVESQEQAIGLINAVYYPPVGKRSMGPQRPQAIEKKNQQPEVLSIVQIETETGYEARNEILSTPGLSSVYIGPVDLALSMGYPPESVWEKGPVWNAVQEIAQTAKQNGLDVGIFTPDAAYSRFLVDEGIIDYCALGMDILILYEGLRRLIKDLS